MFHLTTNVKSESDNEYIISPKVGKQWLTCPSVCPFGKPNMLLLQSLCPIHWKLLFIIVVVSCISSTRNLQVANVYWSMLHCLIFCSPHQDCAHSSVFQLQSKVKYNVFIYKSIITTTKSKKQTSLQCSTDFNTNNEWKNSLFPITYMIKSLSNRILVQVTTEAFSVIKKNTDTQVLTWFKAILSLLWRSTSDNSTKCLTLHQRSPIHV